VEVPIPERVTGTKAYLSEEDAAEECRRLQALNGGKGCVYFVVLARLIVDEATAGTTET
jgi:hypothetical protein